MPRAVSPKKAQGKKAPPKKPQKSQSTIGFETVWKLAHEIGAVEAAEWSGVASIRVNHQLMAWVPTNKAAEPGSLAVRVEMEDRDGLIEEAPETYYIPEHYAKFPCVLVRLREIREDVLRDLLRMGWMSANAATQKRAKPRVRKVGS